MSWRRYDDKYERHPKVLDLISRAGYEAFYRLMRLHGYAAEFRTSGHVPKQAVTDCGVKPKQLAAMVAVGLLDRDQHGQITIHDWGDYAPADPTNADRQARHRAKTRTPEVTDNRNGHVTENVTDTTVPKTLPHARASAPVPVPSLESQNQRPFLGDTERATSERTAPDLKIDYDHILKEV